MKKASIAAALLCAAMTFTPPLTAGKAAEDHEATFVSADGLARYSGTLTMPGGAGPHPAVVLLSVAGPNDRDQTIGKNKGFAELAAALAERGIASLRFDDRGAGTSTGQYFEASWTDLTEDALAAARLLANDPRIDGRAIGFAGMSQGAALSALACKQAPDCRLAVMMSPPGMQGEQAMRSQLEMLIGSTSVPGPVADQYRALMESYFAIFQTEGPRRKEMMVTFLNGPGRALIPPYAFLPKEPADLADVLLGPWYGDNLTFEPAPTYSGLTKPALVVGGDLDPIAAPELHWGSLRKEMAANATFLRLPDANHLLQSATTGLPAEYSAIGHGMAPATSAMIAAWIAATFEETQP